MSGGRCWNSTPAPIQQCAVLRRDRAFALQDRGQALHLRRTDRCGDVGHAVVEAQHLVPVAPGQRLPLALGLAQPSRPAPSFVITIPPSPVVTVLLPKKLKVPTSPNVPT